MVDGEDGITVPWRVMSASHELAFPQRFRRRDAFSSTFSYVPRRSNSLSFSLATFLFSSILVARTEKTGHVIFGIGNACRETFSAGDSRSIGDDL